MNLRDSAAVDRDWEERQRQYGRSAAGLADPAARLERFAAGLERLREAPPRPALFAQAPGLIEAADNVLDFDPACNKPMLLPPK